MFDLDKFVSQNVIKRDKSMFISDIQENNTLLIDKVRGKTLLVIGGAGSIGSSFIRAILPYRPASLTVVDINENALAELTRDLRSMMNMYIPEDYMLYPMDFASPTFAKMFRNHGGFEIVANFSAHKHVRSEKDIYSIEALLRNNVLNAKKLLDLLAEYPPEEYFCVSTDKAANPVNIMGASKRIMEDLIFSYSDCFPVKTARFANVAFSNGSLPAGFLGRMEKLQPISAPKDVKRYFVSMEESGQICMLACMLGRNREIFFPKLAQAQMMSFDLIATQLLRARGYEIVECNSDKEAIEMSQSLRKGSKKYPVYFSISDTSGEKEYEEFYTDNESIDLSRFLSMGVVTGKGLPSIEKLNILLQNFEDVFADACVTKEKVLSLIKEYLPNFEHIEKGKSLDAKM